MPPNTLILLLLGATGGSLLSTISNLTAEMLADANARRRAARATVAQTAKVGSRKDPTAGDGRA